MMTFRQFISEARKNPSMNPKISIYDALSKYQNDSDIFISFTQIDKIGINPNSSFDSPIGVYVYPLRELWSMYKLKLKADFKKAFPFAHHQPYVWIIKKKDGLKYIDDMSKYYHNEYADDLITLEDIIKNMNLDNKTLFKRFIKITRTCRHIPDEVEQFIDSNMSILEEGVFDIIKNKFTKTSKNFTYDIFKMMQKLSLVNGFRKDTVSSFYFMTKFIAMMIANNIKDRNKISIKWNWVLRRCGYSGIFDRSGFGYIYTTEPIQGVFLDINAFDVVEKVLNKNYNNENI